MFLRPSPVRTLLAQQARLQYCRHVFAAITWPDEIVATLLVLCVLLACLVLMGVHSACQCNSVVRRFGTHNQRQRNMQYY